MKKYLASVMVVLVLALAGCATTAPTDNPGPLKTRGDAPPLPGCIDLRERGGSC